MSNLLKNPLSSRNPFSHVLQIKDIEGLKFKQCTYNWYDHALAVGEVLFLLWGIRVCYNVRNAESLYNEAKLISYAIYNIAVVNTLMAAIQWVYFREAWENFRIIFFIELRKIELNFLRLIKWIFYSKVSILFWFIFSLNKNSNFPSHKIDTSGHNFYAPHIHTFNTFFSISIFHMPLTQLPLFIDHHYWIVAVNKKSMFRYFSETLFK